MKVTKKIYNEVYFKYNYNRALVFISYSSQDIKSANLLKSELEQKGMKAFLANNIKPSLNWEKEIIKNLNKCHLFVAMISDNFFTSEWTGQEVGYAFANDKIILPVKLTTVNPKGFIQRHQALRFKGDFQDCTLEIIKIASKYRALKETMVDSLIYALEQVPFSNGFEIANKTFELLRQVHQISEPQRIQIIRVGLKNHQVRLCKEGLQFFQTSTQHRLLDHYEELGEIYKKLKDSYDTLTVERKRNIPKEY